MAKVYIVAQGGEFVVIPPTVVLKNNEDFEIVNVTDQEFKWTMGPEPFDGAVDETVRRKGNPHPAKKVKTKDLLAFYPYLITELKSGQKARGNSDPMIIIDG